MPGPGFYPGPKPQQSPMMLVVDNGIQLEVGTNEEGFMPFHQYIGRPPPQQGLGYQRQQDTYYIIPGDRPVIIQDENGKEIYRVPAVKRKPRKVAPRYIIHDEHGREVHRIGDFEQDRGRPRHDVSYSQSGYSNPMRSERGYDDGTYSQSGGSSVSGYTDDRGTTPYSENFPRSEYSVDNDERWADYRSQRASAWSDYVFVDRSRQGPPSTQYTSGSPLDSGRSDAYRSEASYRQQDGNQVVYV